MSGAALVSGHSASAVLVTPPFLKYGAGPALGPALLAAAATRAGHRVDVVDLNIAWINDRLVAPGVAAPVLYVGDHQRHEGLRAAQSAFFQEIADIAGATPDHVSRMRFEFDEIELASSRLADGTFARWATERLSRIARPDVIGLSLMWSGQVLAAMVITQVARRLWPGVLVVWGGPHVTVLAPEIASDRRYGAVADSFVYGAAEGTFVDMLDAVATRAPLPPACCRAGQPARTAREDLSVLPVFGDLAAYHHGRLTLPAQTTRGCTYGLCAFCTYPATEGAPRLVPLGQIEHVAKLASEVGADLSIKDSLIEPELIAAVGDRLRGTGIRWAVCTKLSAKLDDTLLRAAAQAGLSTIEFGVETFVPNVQRLIRKRQPFDLFLANVEAATRAGIAVVVNYITGFPAEAEAEGRAWLERVQRVVEALGPTVKFSHNTFELERRAPLAALGEQARIRVVRVWPWSSLIEWVPALAACADHRRLPLIQPPA